MPGGGSKFEHGGIGMDYGMEFQQRLIDASEFLGADVPVVNGAAGVGINGESERANGVQEIPIADLGGEQIGQSLFSPEETPQSGQGERRIAAFRAEFFHDHSQALEQIGMPRAPSAFGQAAQPRGGIVFQETITGFLTRAGVQQQVAVFGDKEKDQAINQPQQLAIVVLRGQRTGAEFFFQIQICGMFQETTPQGRDGILDTSA